MRRLLVASAFLFAVGFGLLSQSEAQLGQFIYPTPVSGGGGIAFNSFADLGNNGGTGAPLVAGVTVPSLTNGAIVLCFEGTQSTSTNLTGATLGIQNFVLADTVLGTGSKREIDVMYLLGPTTGAGTLQVNVSSDYALVTIGYYSGVKQSSQPDSHNNGSTTGTSLTVADTVVNANAWLMSCAAPDAAGTYSSGTNTTIRGSGAAFNIPYQFDSNAGVGTGSQNSVFNFSVSSYQAAAVVALQKN